MIELGAIFAAGIWAGMINTVVGSGTLVTFPVLLLFGYPPLTANVSNNIGLLAGSASGVYGYRAEARQHLGLVLRLVPASAAGGLAGALLLFVLPAEAFGAIVPVLIAIGLLMVVVGPSLQRRAAARRDSDDAGTAPATRPRASLVALVFVLGVYGGYFGAAQGILLVGLFGVMLTIGMQGINALKNVLAGVVNGVAAIVFVLVARDHIDGKVVGLIAGGSLIGGYLGARIGRRLPPNALRAVILAVGVVALVRIVFFD
ncbi:sulfite exporter TauE/SafE family protein [Aeromicrobium endophyticum]|uniref:Probable membrane transporter protein n=1 Tax=Aeromicrobium endophyticum TaxID=2292704 RepID=A0A371PC87_9ACTN|nr:sulfite exporter TauE/SafE family protein [Aeromicrobium endophyticum]REK73545.1 sulfite exporter TauE/SafE family protein [Aeromicrobium endophyticum]